MIIRHAEKLSCRERAVSYWLWLDQQSLLLRPLPFALHCNLSAVLHHQQLAQLILQGSMLPVQLLPVPHQLSLLILSLLNGDPLRAGDNLKKALRLRKISSTAKGFSNRLYHRD